MPFNLAGTLAAFQSLVSPRIVLPGLVVKDIRQLDFVALRRAGYRGAVFDKDNCLTLPHKDELVPALEDSWRECRETFGTNNVLIVSNTAGTSSDAGLIQAESVTHHLRVPVLRHRALKPSYSCIADIRTHFAPLRDGELIIVGDRILTDVVLANRMRRRSGLRFWERGGDEAGEVAKRGPLAVWTTTLWERESLLLRWLERGLVSLARRLVGEARASGPGNGSDLPKA